MPPDKLLHMLLMLSVKSLRVSSLLKSPFLGGVKPGGVAAGCADVSYAVPVLLVPCVKPILLVPSGPCGLAIVCADDVVCCDSPG